MPPTPAPLLAVTSGEEWATTVHAGKGHTPTETLLNCIPYPFEHAYHLDSEADWTFDLTHGRFSATAVILADHTPTFGQWLIYALDLDRDPDNQSLWHPAPASLLIFNTTSGFHTGDPRRVGDLHDSWEQLLHGIVVGRGSAAGPGMWNRVRWRAAEGLLDLMLARRPGDRRTEETLLALDDPQLMQSLLLQRSRYRDDDAADSGNETW